MGLSDIIFLNNISIFDLLLSISFIFILGILFVSDYYDLKYDVIPDYLFKTLFVFGFSLNLSLAILFNSLNFLLFSFVMAACVFIFSFVLWMLKFWAGGDVKIFTALSFSLSFLSKDFILNHFANSLMLNYYNSSYVISNLIIFNQFAVYPKVFSILFNGLLLYLPIIFSIIIIRIFKSCKSDFDLKHGVSCPVNLFILIIFNFSKIIKLSTRDSIDIENLKEGMILDKYYFNDEAVFNKIKDLNEDYNLVTNRSGRFNTSQGFYLESGTAAGLTSFDLDFLESIYDEGLIECSRFNIKLTLPFLPSLTLGFIVMLVWGDLIFLISSAI